jgi:hypothetical protein
MFAPSPLKKALVYDQPGCQLRLEGLPDLSADHGGHDLGILTGWSLRWPGRPELEGQRDHLEALVAAVLPYARQLLSGVEQRAGDASGPIWIGPAEAGGHVLHLASSQSGNPTLDVQLDDADLADLVRVLDQMRLDPRVRLALAVPQVRPFKTRELIRRVPLRRRLAAPVGGVAALALAAGLAALLPAPTLRPETPTAPTATQRSQR